MVYGVKKIGKSRRIRCKSENNELENMLKGKRRHLASIR